VAIAFAALCACDGDTDTQEATASKGAYHVGRTNTGDYVDLGVFHALRSNGVLTSIGGSGVTEEAYATSGERLCHVAWLTNPRIDAPACTISGGVVSGQDPPQHAFDFDRFAVATRVSLFSTWSGSVVNVACAIGPTATPCQGDTSSFVDEASMLAALPTAIDLHGGYGDITVLEAGGSLIVYATDSTSRSSPIPDAVRLFGDEFVLDRAGGLWNYGGPVWLGDDPPASGITAVSSGASVIAFDDGSTWFDTSLAYMWGDGDRLGVETHRPGIRLPGAVVEIIGDASLGAALVDGDFWVWADEGHTDFLDWDFFSPEPNQVLGWE